MFGQLKGGQAYQILVAPYCSGQGHFSRDTMHHHMLPLVVFCALGRGMNLSMSEERLIVGASLVTILFRANRIFAATTNNDSEQQAFFVGWHARSPVTFFCSCFLGWACRLWTNSYMFECMVL